MSEILDGKSSINVKWLTMWPLKTDKEDGTIYEETPRTFGHQLNSAKYAPAVETAEQNGDGIKVEEYIAKNGGSLEVVIRGFTRGDSGFLFGETETADGTSISNSGDIVPYNCVAYATERSDGLLNLYKFPKTKFMPQGEDNRQREGTSVSYATATLSGKYSPLISNGDDSYKHYGADPKTDKEFIDNWFKTALFHTADDGTTSSEGGSDAGTT